LSPWYILGLKNVFENVRKYFLNFDHVDGKIFAFKVKKTSFFHLDESYEEI